MVDARTGQLKWQYDPEVPGIWDVRACCGVQNRGAAVWKGRVYFGTLDGRLIALDAETGEHHGEHAQRLDQPIGRSLLIKAHARKMPPYDVDRKSRV